MTTENTNRPTIQLSAEETEEIALELGHTLIIVISKFVRAYGLDPREPNTVAMIAAVLDTMRATLPGAAKEAATPEVKA